MERLRRVAQQLLHPLGMHLARWRPSFDDYARVLGAIRERSVTTVLDVGANSGQFAQGLIAAGFTGTIHSFEPQSAIHAQLCRHAAPYPAWRIAERCALGDAPGELVLNISRNTYSSSLLPNTSLVERAAPETITVAQEQVPVLRLDAWSAAMPLAGPLFLKIDTQGFELKVLRGATGMLGRVEGILVETSLAPLYQGQPPFSELVAFLAAAGFDVVDVLPGLRDALSGRFLGLDLLAIRQAPGSVDRSGS